MRFKGIAYRALSPFWSPHPTSGEGAKRYGGRFNPKDVDALYLALTETTALAEFNQGFTHRPQPKTLCAYEIDCEDILDLTNDNLRKEVGISQSEMACGWQMLSHNKQIPPTWALAKKLIKESVAGIIVPSYAKNAPEDSQNLVLWKWSDDLPYKVKVIDDKGTLPSNQSSWK